MNKCRLGFILGNGFPCTLFGIIFYLNRERFIQSGGVWNWTHILLLIQLVLTTVLFVLRKQADEVSWHPWDAFIAFTGTFSVYALAPEGPENLIWAGVALQMAGIVLAIMSLISPGRSFGLLAAARGWIKTGGFYSLIRHPMYASCFLFNTGYFLNHPSLFNLQIILLCFLCLIARMYSEERLLVKDPEYAAYMARVRWRVFPFIS